MKTHSRKHNSPGFSLVEVALALGVAAFALVAIIGLVPIGINSVQGSLERTTAANIVANVAADLKVTSVTVPPMIKNSPRYQIPLPIQESETHTLFLREDGSAAGKVDTDAAPTQDPRYRLTLFFTAPDVSTQKSATLVRVLVTWPALADSTVKALPTKYQGSYEIVTALNRN